MNKGKKVFVGLSGGVDSSVSAALLKKQGFTVTGVYIKTWHPDWLPCTWREERRDAMRVAAHLEIPFLTLDLEKEYKEKVADYMISEYKAGRTPNPDIMCNKEIKFGSFLQKSLEMGADYIATGHYAQIIKNENNITLVEGKDTNKDQSYFLWTLTQEQLAHTIFPVGGYTKPQVRKLAKKFGLPTADKKDSQGICFLGKVDMKEFLGHYIEQKKGDVLNEKGEVIGSHAGAVFLTIGERHGFEIFKKTATDTPYYVLSKNINTNTIVVGQKQDTTRVQTVGQKVELKDIHLNNKNTFPLKLEARIRYRQQRQRVTLTEDGKKYVAQFDISQEGMASGQSIVFYLGDACLGGGIIENISK